MRTFLSRLTRVYRFREWNVWMKRFDERDFFFFTARKRESIHLRFSSRSWLDAIEFCMRRINGLCVVFWSIDFFQSCSRKRMTKIKEVSFLSNLNLAEKICRNIICNHTIFLSAVSRCAVKFYYRQWGIIECAHDTVTFGWFRGNICSLEYRCESRFEWF